MGSMSNHNCCKGFCFKEKVEKHWCKQIMLMVTSAVDKINVLTTCTRAVTVVVHIDYMTALNQFRLITVYEKG